MKTVQRSASGQQAVQAKPGTRKPKVVRVTVEMPEAFVKLLDIKAALSVWTRWAPNSQDGALPPSLDAGSIVAWLVLQEARGQRAELIHAATPLAWRGADCLEMIHEERRVYEVQPDGTRLQISGPDLMPKPQEA